MVVLGQDPYFNPNQAHGKPDSPYMGCYFYPNMNHHSQVYKWPGNGDSYWDSKTFLKPGHQSCKHSPHRAACICSYILSVLILIITLTATLCIAVLVCRAQLQCMCRSSYTPKVRHMATHSQAAETHALVQQPLCIFCVGGSKVPCACLLYMLLQPPEYLQGAVQ